MRSPERARGMCPAIGIRMDRRVEPVRSAQLERAKASIAGRLKHVCVDMSEAAFDALVERIALVKIKYTMRTDTLARVRPPR